MNRKSKIQNKKALAVTLPALATAGGPEHFAGLDREGLCFFAIRSARVVRALRAGASISNYDRPSQSVGADPSGKKYCVPFTGWLSLWSSSCKSSFRSTKSISDVSITSRSEDL